MNNRKKFFFNGILMSIVGLALRTVGLVFGAYISRTIGAEGVGLNTLISTIYAFALTFATSGISLTTTRLVAGHIGEGSEAEIGRTLRGAILYSLSFSGAATLLLVALSGTLATAVIGDVRAIFPLQLLSLSLIPSALVGVFSGYFVGTKRVVANAALQVVGQCFRIVLTIYLLSGLLGGGVEEAVGALCIGSTITDFLIFLVALVIFLVDRTLYKVSGEKRDGASVRAVAKTALPLAFSAYIRSALLSLEHSLIPRRLELYGEDKSSALSSFGVMHGMALPMILYPMSPLSSFSGLLVPEFAEAEAAGARARAERIAKEAISATLIYSILAAVLFLVFSEELGYIVYASYEAGQFISLLAFVVPIMYLDHVVDSMLKGIGEQVYSMWINIADSTLSVILVFLIIPALGISGYAIVIIVMELFNFVASYLRLKRRIAIRLDIGYSVFLPTIAAGASALAVRALFVRLGSSASVPALIAQLVFSVAVFIATRIVLAMIYSLLKGKRS